MAHKPSDVSCPGCGDRLGVVGDIQMGEIHLALLHCKTHGSFGEVSGLLEMDGNFVARVIDQRETLTSPASQPPPAIAGDRTGS